MINKSKRQEESFHKVSQSRKPVSLDRARSDQSCRWIQLSAKTGLLRPRQQCVRLFFIYLARCGRIVRVNQHDGGWLTGWSLGRLLENRRIMAAARRAPQIMSSARRISSFCCDHCFFFLWKWIFLSLVYFAHERSKFDERARALALLPLCAKYQVALQLITFYVL
jgi:hypothetical protein